MKGVPCTVCGSTRSVRTVYAGGTGAICVANADGRDRCRERELRRMPAEAETGRSSDRAAGPAGGGSEGE